MKIRWIGAVVMAAALGGCAAGGGSPSPQQGAQQGAAAAPTSFVMALEDAAIPEPSEEMFDLVSLAPGAPGIVERMVDGERQVLMAMFTSAATVERFYSGEGGQTPSGKPMVWVTAVPEMQTACRTWSGGETRRHRLMRWLGLPPTAKSDSVVELWVPADRVLRPCSDPRTDVSACSSTAAAATTAPGVTDYPAFLAGLYVQSYSINGAPWTRLGYTYDWDSAAAPLHRGASEFMLAPDTSYSVSGRWALDAYCAPS